VQMVGCTNTVKIHVVRELGDGKTSLSNHTISDGFAAFSTPNNDFGFRAEAPPTYSG